LVPGSISGRALNKVKCALAVTLKTYGIDFYCILFFFGTGIQNIPPVNQEHLLPSPNAKAQQPRSFLSFNGELRPTPHPNLSPVGRPTLSLTPWQAKDGQKDGQKDGKKDGQKDGQNDGQKGQEESNVTLKPFVPSNRSKNKKVGAVPGPPDTPERNNFIAKKRKLFSDVTDPQIF
jgi:hypothetical protein